MNLKSGCIFWPQVDGSAPLPSAELMRDIRCDVAIIGGGISGALSAYHLAREGVHTVLLDRGQVGQQSTAASTGLLQYEIDMPLVDLIARVGRERATAAYRASVEALLAFEPLIAGLKDSCGLVSRPSLYLASKEEDVESLRAECEARQSIGIEVQFLSREALKDQCNFSRPAALWSRRAFEIDPYRLTRELIAESIRMGLELFTNTNIVRCEPASDGMTLHTAGQSRVVARKVVIATGYETMQMLPESLCRLSSTYALASQPLENLATWPHRCLIWESARPYFYARTTRDNRVMFGGEDEDIVDPQARDKLLPAKARKLCQRFSELFPAIPIDSDCAWAGTFAQTQDGLPYIGQWKQAPHCYFALGYGGNGITFSLLAGRIIRDLFLGRAAEQAALFSFER